MGKSRTGLWDSLWQLYLRGSQEARFLEVFDGVPQAEIALDDLKNGLDMIAALSAKTGFIKSNSEARRALGENSISVNKEKVTEGYCLSEKDLLNQRFILLQRGKKNYFLIIVK